MAPPTVQVFLPQNQLGALLRFGQNFNNIDLLMGVGYEFLDAVKVLQQWLRRYQEDHTATNR